MIKFFSIMFSTLITLAILVVPFQPARAATVPNVIATIPVGNRGFSPHGVAVNPNTNRIYVANNKSNNVSVIDGSTNDMIVTVNVGQLPVGIAVNPNTNRIYVTNQGSNTVSVIEGATNSVAAIVNVGD